MYCVAPLSVTVRFDRQGTCGGREYLMFGNALFANVLPSKITCVPRPGKAQFPNTHTQISTLSYDLKTSFEHHLV